MRWTGPYHGDSSDSLTHEEMKGLGCDLLSIVADPLFADPKSGDFTLPPDSPARQLGFKAIDTTDVGPRGAYRRA